MQISSLLRFSAVYFAHHLDKLGTSRDQEKAAKTSNMEPIDER